MILWNLSSDLCFFGSIYFWIWLLVIFSYESWWTFLQGEAIILIILAMQLYFQGYRLLNTSILLITRILHISSDILEHWTSDSRSDQNQTVSPLFKFPKQAAQKCHVPYCPFCYINSHSSVLMLLICKVAWNSNKFLRLFLFSIFAEKWHEHNKTWESI